MTRCASVELDQDSSGVRPPRAPWEWEEMGPSLHLVAVLATVEPESEERVAAEEEIVISIAIMPHPLVAWNISKTMPIGTNPWKTFTDWLEQHQKESRHSHDV
jgi:hypothetical protein